MANPPTTMAPVTTAPVTGCKKLKSVLTIKAFKRVRKVTKAKQCEMICKNNSKRCKVWTWFKKSKMCVLQTFMFKRDKKAFSSGMIDCMVPNMKDASDIAFDDEM